MTFIKNSLVVTLVLLLSVSSAYARLGYTLSDYESKNYVKLSGPSPKSDNVFLIEYTKDEYKIFADFMNGESHMVMYWRSDGQPMTKEELTSLMNINSKGIELKSFMSAKRVVPENEDTIWYNSIVMCVTAEEKKLLSCETNEYRKYRFAIKKEQEIKRSKEIEKNF